jgi:hypothetical protein
MFLPSPMQLKAMAVMVRDLPAPGHTSPRMLCGVSPASYAMSTTISRSASGAS